LARGETELVRVSVLAVAVYVALVAGREAARIEGKRELPQLAARAGITDRHVEIDRSFWKRTQASGIDPQRAGIGDVGGEEVAGGAVGGLGERVGHDDEKRQGQSDRPTVRPLPH